MRSIEHLGAAQYLEQTVTTEEGYTETLDVARISPSLIRMTGEAPVLGRPLLAEDEQAGAPPVVLIDETVWERFFGRDPGVLGRTLRVGAVHASVVGVMPAGFGFPVNFTVWTPLRVEGAGYGPRQGPPVEIYGILRPGVSLEAARAELAALGARAAADLPATHERLRPRVDRFGRGDGEMRWVIQGLRFVFLLLMLVMCVNVATLMFARTATRQGEIAVRSALGASRRRIVAQLFVEALVLTLVASAAGLTAAWAGLRWGMQIFWRVQQAANPPFWWDDALRPTTVAYTLTLAVVAAAMLGVLPALKVTGRRVQASLRRLSTGGTGMRFGGVWTALVVLQVALSVTFLPTAFLSARDAMLEAERDSGFPADEYLTARVLRELEVPAEELPPGAREAESARTAELFAEVKRRVAAEPGVSSVVFTGRIPGLNNRREVIVFDTARVVPDTLVEYEPHYLAVDEDYLEAMDAEILAGRGFRPADFAPGSRAVIVNQAFVAEYTEGRSPVGTRIRYPGREEDGSPEWYEIVGVAQNTEMDAYGPGALDAVYHPLVPGRDEALQMFVEAGPRAASLGPRLRAVVTSVDPSLRLGETVTVRETWAAAHQSGRIFALLQALIVLAALLLSMAGVHALMSFTVSQRTREIGIRTALGARPRRIVASIFSRALGQLGAGVLLGTVFALALRWDDLTTEGPTMVASIVVAMLTVGLLACFIPARRALRIQPTEALKAGG